LPTTPNPSNANLLMATWATSNPNVALVLGDGREMTLCYSEENNVEKAASELTHPAPSIEGFGKDEINVTCALTLDSYTTFDVYIAPKEEGTTMSSRLPWSTWATWRMTIWAHAHGSDRPQRLPEPARGRRRELRGQLR
jgi:hypothetical protein